MSHTNKHLTSAVQLKLEHLAGGGGASLMAAHLYCLAALLLVLLFWLRRKMSLFLQAAVDALYSFRDLYFESHGLEQASQKNVETKAKLQETLLILDNIQGNGKSRLSSLQRS